MIALLEHELIEKNETASREQASMASRTMARITLSSGRCGSFQRKCEH